MGIRIKIDIDVYDLDVSYVDPVDFELSAVAENSQPDEIIAGRVETLAELLGVDYETAESIYMEHRT